VIGERGLGDGQVEYKARQQPEAQNVNLSDIQQYILTQLN